MVDKVRAANNVGNNVIAAEEDGSYKCVVKGATQITVETVLDGAPKSATLGLGDNASVCTVNGKDGVKVGTSKLGGSMTITLPAGATKLTLHAAAWNGVTGLSLNITGVTADVSKIDLTANAGISNNSPFTLVDASEDDFVFVLNFEALAEETTITFTSSIAKRFVVWDATYVC